MSKNENVIEIKNLSNFLGEQWVHKELNLTVKKGEIVAIIGASGCGKTTLIRSILMLQPPTSGEVNVFGTNLVNCSPAAAQRVRERWSVMFQSGALFSSLNLLENVMFPMAEYTHLKKKKQKELALLKIAMVGLDMEAAKQYPAELSGGMKKRAALARALALEPELMFLDEPTTGLDPQSAGEIDDLILGLQKNMGVTLVMVTHDIDTLWQVPDRVVYLGEKKVLAAAPIEELVKMDHPLIRSYFSGSRAQSRQKLSENDKEKDSEQNKEENKEENKDN